MRQGRHPTCPIDLTADDVLNAQEAVGGFDFDDESDSVQNGRPSTFSRSPSATNESKMVGAPLDSLPWGDRKLSPGVTVELQPHPPRCQGDFLLIRQMFQDTSGHVHLRGLRLRRTKFLAGMLPPKRNELCLLISVSNDDKRDHFVQGEEVVSIDIVHCTRNLIFSEQPWPAHSYSNFNGTTIPDYDVAANGLLICRHVMATIHDTTKKKQKHEKASEGLLRCLSATEITAMGWAVSTPAATSSSKEYREHFRMKRYSYGSGCCGAGGDTQGAKMAGVSIAFGWDLNANACMTFAANHPEADVIQEESSLVCPQCDLLFIYHLSPPCQYFSPAHTREGRKDEENSAAMFMVGEKLRQSKPLYHTQENTAGLFSRHPEYFCFLLNMIIEEGYNVSWKICQLADYGLPAKRKRLVLFASRVGLPLPRFPDKTHGSTTSRPLQMVHDAIAHIPDDADWHWDTVRYLSKPTQPYDARCTQLRCITTGGSEHNHPDGTRKFSIRELACLQGFPMDYRFPEGALLGDLTRQIGNAVPPSAWKYFVRAIMESHKAFLDGRIDVLGNEVNETGDQVIVDLT